MNSSPDKNGRQGPRRLFEALAVILLSLATVGTAWCSYQASAWASYSTDLSILSSTAGRTAEVNRLEANQMLLLDVNLFSEYLKARLATNEPLAGFYAGKFRPQLKQAVDAWMRTLPFENSAAPPHPFVTNFYLSPQLKLAEQKEAESQRLWSESENASRLGNSYILVSVLLATALFFAGTAPQFETYKARRVVLTIGLAVLLAAITTFIRLPLTTRSGPRHRLMSAEPPEPHMAP